MLFFVSTGLFVLDGSVLDDSVLCASALSIRSNSISLGFAFSLSIHKKKLSLCFISKVTL